MKTLAALILVGVVVGLVYLNSTHEDGLSGVWNDLTNRHAPSVEIEYQPIVP
jgi:hypothetical protein